MTECDHPGCTVNNPRFLHKFVFVSRPTEKYLCSDHIDPFLNQCASEGIDVRIVPQSEWIIQ